MNTIDTIIKEIEGRLTTFKLAPGFEERGVVSEIGDGVVSILGLGQVSMGEEVIFLHAQAGKRGIRGQIIELTEDKAWAIVFGEYERINEGSSVKRTGQALKIGVNDSLLGRIVNPLLEALDEKGEIRPKKYVPIEKIAPGPIERSPVNTPLRTGIKVVDALIPIGRGQRELIIGDRSTGKTSLALDTMLSQKDVICIYVAIGQKQSNVAQIYDKLKSGANSNNFIVISATSSDSPSLQYIAPYVGTAIGEYFMENKRDVLIVYDDLTKHAWAYRQISLVLKKPSGREAYPGDIFYLHSRLLERACKLAKGGSITALPIVETHAGDITTYIPTNIISITDGQIYLESDLFYAGIRPAVNVGLSVSRVGGAAQTKKVKTVAGPLRLELAQYRELAGFAQFGSDLDKATRDKLDRGARITEVFKQSQFSQVSEEELIIVLFAVTQGFFDEIPVEKCQEFEKGLFSYMVANQKKLIDEIKKSQLLTDEISEKLKTAIEKFKNTFKD